MAKTQDNGSNSAVGEREVDGACAACRFDRGAGMLLLWDSCVLQPLLQSVRSSEATSWGAWSPQMGKPELQGLSLR